jgi:hypothetical protein
MPASRRPLRIIEQDLNPLYVISIYNDRRAIDALIAQRLTIGLMTGCALAA